MRFEVFKRDSFTCQYCGKSAPDVTLHIDHIEPVSKGGKTTLMNLITSCSDCNLGKSDRVLDDNAAVSRAKKQAGELAARKEQIEMMSKWYKSLATAETVQVDIISERINELTGYELNENGRRDVRLWLKKYTTDEIMEAVDLSQRYLQSQGDGTFTSDSFELAFKRIPGICRNKKEEKDNPVIKEIFYIAGILYNKHGIYKRESIPDIKRIISLGADPEDLIQMARVCDDYEEFLSMYGL